MKNGKFLKVLIAISIFILLFAVISSLYIRYQVNEMELRLSEDVVPGYLVGKSIYIRIEDDDFIDYMYIDKVIDSQKISTKVFID